MLIYRMPLLLITKDSNYGEKCSNSVSVIENGGKVWVGSLRERRYYVNLSNLMSGCVN